MSIKQKSNAQKKPLSSIKYCEEKFNCSTDKATADIFCSICESNQCKNCEIALHKNSNESLHERYPIGVINERELCENKCETLNYADVICENCKKNYCYTCYDKLHRSGSYKMHKNKDYKQLKKLSMPINQTINRKSNEDNTEQYFSLTSPEPFDPALAELPDIANIFTETQNLVSYDSALTPSDVYIDQNYENEDDIYNTIRSFMLIDQNEKLMVKDADEFCKALECDDDYFFKVVSIFGNTGDGKSFTLNHTFCGGREVFKTSSNPDSCTIGVWAAFDPIHKALLIDTEGLLGISENSNQRTRLLLKVLAISDVIIYRTRAERLHTDLFRFLNDASIAYEKHFCEELKALQKRCSLEDQEISSLGPAVIIFHETRDTDILGKAMGQTSSGSSALIKKRFAQLDLRVDAFRAIDYVGTRTMCQPTEFKFLRHAVETRLKDDSVRSKRRPSVVLQALKTLNDKFSGKIDMNTANSFPDEYFTCIATCLSCNARCSQTVNHANIPHSCSKRCIYQSQYDNKIYYCKGCYDAGENRLVVPKTSGSHESSWVGFAKFAWSGYVLECTKCGVIYRSRQYWYGNDDPDRAAVRTIIQHVWPDGVKILGSSHNAAQKLLDGIQYVSEGIVNLSAKPAKAVSNIVNDHIAPAYWVPNSKIKSCFTCGVFFGGRESIHHCRSCGKGFCDECSSFRRTVPERGWGQEKVRVCKLCFKPDSEKLATIVDPRDIRARKIGEVVQTTLNVVANVMEYPRDVVKDSARPSYWTPDNECKECYVCSNFFNLKNPIHHCRACGEGVCDGCSKDRIPVPYRGWDGPVRVCSKCVPNISNSDCDGLFVKQ